jgi:dolichol-phosphate mannosyltransferase
VTGWTALIIAILFLGGAQLISLGIIGEYVGRLYGEAKRRPLYLVRETLGLDTPVQSYPRLEPARENRSRPDRRSWRERRSTRDQRTDGRRSAQPA